MKTVATCAAIAGLLALSGGSAAWAQTYSTTPGTQGSYSSSPGSQGSWNPNQATQAYPNQGTYGTNQGSWSSGMQGTSTPSGGQPYSQAGYGSANITTYQQAEQELARYGYNNVHDLRSMQGWSVDAMRNGQRVHVILGDNGMIATFPGR
jgi:hypothetical protein